MKDINVYVVSADDITIDGGYSIDHWNDCEQKGDPLPQEAIDFINLAKERKHEYSLKGFMIAVNITEDVCTLNDYVFITKY